MVAGEMNFAPTMMMQPTDGGAIACNLCFIFIDLQN